MSMLDLFTPELPHYESTILKYMNYYTFVLIYGDDKCIGIINTTNVCAFIYNGSQLMISVPNDNPITINSTNVPTIITVSFPLLYLRSPKEALMKFAFCTQHVKSILFDNSTPTTLTVSTTDSSHNLSHDNNEQSQFMMNSFVQQLRGEDDEYVIEITNL